MIGLRKRLPPPNSLVAFEAAARHLNFTHAGTELGVTQAAVSRQISGLEGQLGLALFQRNGARVSLTHAGERLYHSVSMALGHIATTVDELKELERDEHLLISTTVATLNYWLAPRMAGFRKLHPEVKVRLMASDPFVLPNLDRDTVAILHGDGRWPGVRAVKLFDADIIAVCTPSYAEQLDPLPTAVDLPKYSLLQLDEIRRPPLNWRLWLAANGVPNDRAPEVTTIENVQLLIQAITDDEGIGLLWSHVAEPLLASGVLVQPLSASQRLKDAAYYLIYSQHEPTPRPVALFRDWLTQATGRA